MYATEVPRLEAAVVGVGLGPSASLGSWCILRQTHEMPHVDGDDKQARLCIYLKAWLADCRSESFLAVKTKGEPSDGNIWMVMMTLVVQIAIAAVARSVLSVAAECSSRWCSAWAAVIEEVNVEWMLEGQEVAPL